MSSRSVLITAAHDDSVTFWDVATKQVLGNVVLKDTQINTLCMTSTGSACAAAGNVTLRIFDCNNVGQVLRSFAPHRTNITSVTFSTDNRCMYTASEDRTVQIWDTRADNFYCQGVLELCSPVNSLVIHPNDVEIIIADSTGTIYVWDVRKFDKDNKISIENPEFMEYFTSVDVDQSGKKLAGVTNRGKLYTYDARAASDNNGHTFMTDALDEKLPGFGFQAHSIYGLRTKFAPDCKRLLTTAGEDAPALWDVTQHTPEGLAKLQTFGTSIPCRKSSYQHPRQASNLPNRLRWTWGCAFTNDSKYVFLGGGDSVLRAFDVDSGEEVVAYKKHAKGITALALYDPPAFDVSSTSRASHDVHSRIE